MAKMLCAKFKGQGKFELEEVPVPQIKNDDDVLIKVTACGICGTDIHILEVPQGHPAKENVILGHEYTGKVVEVGKNVKHLKPGDNVVVDPNLTCGVCNYCRNALPNQCENMTTLGIFIDGGFAEFNVAPAKALFKISSDVQPEIAALAEPLSCIVNAVNKSELKLGQNVVVLGAGPIGLLFAMVFKSAGAGKVIVAEISDTRRNFAKICGADLVCDPREINLKECVLSKTNNLGADIVVDAVGSLLQQALSLVKRNGKIILFGMNENIRSEVKQYDITRYEIEILGTYIAKYTFPSAINILESRIAPFEKLITKKLPLASVKEGIELAKTGEVIKIVILP